MCRQLFLSADSNYFLKSPLAWMFISPPCFPPNAILGARGKMRHFAKLFAPMFLSVFNLDSVESCWAKLVSSGGAEMPLLRLNCALKLQFCWGELRKFEASVWNAKALQSERKVPFWCFMLKWGPAASGVDLIFLLFATKTCRCSLVSNEKLYSKIPA